MTKYKGYCLTCVVHVHPEIKTAKNYKTKETDVVERIKASFPNFDWVADKRVAEGCSLRRPDLLLDLGSHVIICEIDETAHAGYECICEHRRLMELSQDLGHRPVVFIRFNPDAYTDHKGVRVTSCWKTNQAGTVIVPEKRRQEWADRIETLKSHIQYWIDTPSEKTVEIIELYY
jgi:hypothetical protein